MSEINDATLVAGLRRQMAIAVARQVAAAGNLANADTPGYRAREVPDDFGLVLDRQVTGELRLVSTDPAHRGGGDVARVIETREAEDLPARRDGNTVQLDRELLAMATASADFAKAQTALAAKFRLVRYAINEGR